MATIAPLADRALLQIHGRRLSIAGDGQASVNSVLALDGIAVGATRAPATTTLIGTGLSGAGAVTLTGAAVGDTVSKVYDQNAANWVDVTSSFEATITVANQIQETVSVSGHQVIVYLTPNS